MRKTNLSFRKLTISDQMLESRASFCIYKATGVSLHNLSSNALWIYTPFLFERYNSGNMLSGLWKLTETLSIAETSSFSTTYI